MYAGPAGKKIVVGLAHLSSEQKWPTQWVQSWTKVPKLRITRIEQNCKALTTSSSDKH
jgi:hypothetical protein